MKKRLNPLQNKKQYEADANLGGEFNENAFGRCKVEAEQGFSYAQFKLGYYYYHGVGTSKNHTKSIEWYEKAANQKNALASYNMGIIHEYGQEVDKKNAKAFKYYNIAASQGLPSAQFKLGYFCIQGYGTEIDYKKSIEWYNKAADQGHIIAMYYLGNLYWNDQGFENNINFALEYYRMAADQGYAHADFQLGNLYHKGYGVEFDSIKAREWYTRAIYQNIIEFSYKSLSSRNIQEVNIEGKLMIVQEYEDAANGGHVDSQIKLGLLYYFGNFVEKNIDKSIDLISTAAKKNPEALALLGDLYHCAADISTNFSKALKSYRKVPDGRNKSSALRGIGLLYEYGDGVNHDPKKALEYYQLSADLGNKAAYYNLVLFYYHGIEVKRNFHEAFVWFNRINNIEPRDGVNHVFIQDMDVSASDGGSRKTRNYTLASESVISGEANYYLGTMHR
jgi:TPR repeat protein